MLIAVLPALMLTAKAARSMVLTYDHPVLHMVPGQSVSVGATLYVPSGYYNFSDFGYIISEQPGLHTGEFGELLFTVGDSVFPTGGIYVGQQGIPSWDPAFLLHEERVHFIPGRADLLSNLHVASGRSIHLVLGQIFVGAAAPAGITTTNIGIYQQCLGWCWVDPDAPPSFADAGPLTIEVVVPEPAVALLMVSGLAGLASARRTMRNGRTKSA
jgi:hypothetical protein